MNTILSLFPYRFYAPIAERIRQKQTRVLDYDKHTIYMSQGVRHWQCSSEPEVVSWIEQSFSPGDVFYDIGANVGAFSLISSKFHDHKVITYAFEPAYNTLPLLVENIFLNDCEKSIFPISMPLSEASELSRFHYHTFLSGAGYHTIGTPKEQSQNTGKIYQPVFTQFVLCVSIDSLVKDYGLAAPNHIKLDVDGIEYQILKGAKNTLMSDSMKSILMEIADPEEEKKIMDLLLECGFKVKDDFKHDNTSNRIFVK